MTEKNYERTLKIAISVTFIFFLIEAAGGFFSGSLSLLSDAGHMLRDVFALLLSLVAISVARRIASKDRTFGYHRVEIFAAFINGLVLIGISIGIFYEAVGRLSNPAPINSSIMFVVAAIGLGANLAVALKLQGSHDLNVRSAFLHVLSDTISSLAVLVAAVVITFTGQTISDPILSMAIAVVILGSSILIIRDTVSILLQFTPRGIDLDQVVKDIFSVKGVDGVHNVHLWTLCSNINILDAHIYSCERDVTAIEAIKQEVKRRLETYQVRHSTLEFECEACMDCRVVRQIED
jgi:cobalt-zinc-cadmium efflux system protein